MVTFILVKRNGNILVYRYYPNDERSKSPGEITVDLDNQLFEITELAEDDFEYDISPEEINILINAINEGKRERGETGLEELVKESEHGCFFGDHAVSGIDEEIRLGKIPEKGMRAWY